MSETDHVAATAGFILAGGQSSRMGVDKGLLEIAGVPMIVRAARLVEVVVMTPAVVVGTPGKYRDLILQAIVDDWPGSGPLGGIATALRASDADWNLIVACDLPYLTREWLEYLLGRGRDSDAEAVVPMNPAPANKRGAEPLCAMYHKGAEPTIRRALEQGVRKVIDGLTELRVEVIEPAKWKGFDSDGLLFKNVNTPADYDEAQRKLGGRGKMSEHYFEFKNVCKAFDNNAVLKDVSFFVEQGETCVIMGRSGVGKSVSLKLLLGFLAPDSGRIIVAGQDVTDWTEEQFSQIRRRVTMVFQSGALFDSLTVEENVAFPLVSRSETEAPEKIDAAVKELMTELEVVDYADRLPSDLSTGAKRAVAIARALAEDPDAILYDEPTTMVDPLMAAHVSDLIAKLKAKLHKTSIVVTHDTHLAKKLADRILFLQEGRVGFFGTWQELENSKEPFLRNFLAQDEMIPALDATE